MYSICTADSEESFTNILTHQIFLYDCIKCINMHLHKCDYYIIVIIDYSLLIIYVSCAILQQIITLIKINIYCVKYFMTKLSNVSLLKEII